MRNNNLTKFWWALTPVSYWGLFLTLHSTINLPLCLLVTNTEAAAQFKPHQTQLVVWKVIKFPGYFPISSCFLLVYPCHSSVCAFMWASLLQPSHNSLIFSITVFPGWSVLICSSMIFLSKNCNRLPVSPLEFDEASPKDPPEVNRQEADLFHPI